MSTRRTRRCSAAAALTAPSTARPARNCWQNVAVCMVAEPATRRSPRVTVCPRSSSSTPSVRSGTAAPTASRNCYRRSLEVAVQNGVHTIAFPCISTGVYGYPVGLAARIAVNTVRTALRQLGAVAEVIFCCFSAPDLAIYQGLLNAPASRSAGAKPCSHRHTSE